MSHDNELSPWQLHSIAPFGQALVVTGAPKRLGMAEWECIQDVAALRIFFNFNIFLKLILNLTRSGFFKKTNTFGRSYCPGAAKCLCRAMHGGAVEG